MEEVKTIYSNYNGKLIKIPNIYDFKTYLKKIQEEYKLSEIQMKFISFEFLFKNDNSNLTFEVKTEDEYYTALEIGYSYDKIISKIKLPELDDLDSIINRLKQRKKELIKDYLAIKKKNLDLKKELSLNNKENGKVNEESLENNNEEKKNNNHLKEKNIINSINDLFIKFNCHFLDNDNIENHIIKIKLNKISQNNPIKYHFRVRNNGNNKWPNDTILKCMNDDTEIFFFYSSINDYDSKFINDNDGGYQMFTIIVIFKNYCNIQVGYYNLRAYLISDKFGRIGDEFGNLIVQVLPPDNNSFFF